MTSKQMQNAHRAAKLRRARARFARDEEQRALSFFKREFGRLRAKQSVRDRVPPRFVKLFLEEAVVQAARDISQEMRQELDKDNRFSAHIQRAAEIIAEGWTHRLFPHQQMNEAVFEMSEQALGGTSMVAFTITIPRATVSMMVEDRNLMLCAVEGTRAVS